MVSREGLERNRKANASLSRLINNLLTEFFFSLDLSKPEAARDALLAFIPLLVEKYGPVSETIALDWYAQMRADSGAEDSYRVTAPPVADVTEAVEANVRYAAGHLFTDEPEAALGTLSGAVDKHVKQAGRDAIIWNAEAEGVSWARVPTGAKTCSFCLVLASRDAVFTSQRYAGSRKFGEDNLFHPEDDCEIVRMAPGDDYPEDYLPDDYYDMYTIGVDGLGDPDVQAFMDSLDPDDKNAQLKGIVFSMRRNFPDVVSDGVHAH